MADVKLSTRGDSGCNNMVIATLREPFCNYIGPVHQITSNSDCPNQSTKWDIIDFISRCFVDENNGEGYFSTSITN
jgi:hypothetical protein